MIVSGFTFIRNAILYDYPIVESIISILDICDEVIVAVGKSEDKTLELIQEISSNKIRIIETEWDLSLREGGRVLAEETNKAMSAIDKNSDWCLYIQGDEVIHEKYLQKIKQEMHQWKDHPDVEGLLFKYRHFYGSYDYVGDSHKWYRNEIRIIRNGLGIKSYRDAQGFRLNNRKLKVKEIDAYIYHYGWVKPPELQSAKIRSFLSHWHQDEWVKENQPKQDFDYGQIDSLKTFKEDHPKVMRNRIKSKNWDFDFDPTVKNFGVKAKLLYFIEKYLGFRPGEYKNYRKI
ncbi:MAG: glycosyltransferase family 2 protein [Bacteroidales bacterium]|nr:glycosyltransferase family 2 protein [Bacteroidales bacterium]